jgi:serine/threonine protein kinase
MGVGNQTNLVYLIDFGLSKELRNPNTHKHIPYNKGLGFIGTTMFASINSHMGLELGRRDDLESLAYVLFYFLWGFLPWQDLTKGEAILESKRTITTHNLFLGLPVEFHTFFEHCRSLPFDLKPNYDYFYDLFGNLILREGFQLDIAFDWDVTDGENRGIRIRVGPFSMNTIILPSALHGKCPTYLVLTINISLHSDNGLYAGCALSVAGSHIHPLVLSHAAASHQ